MIRYLTAGESHGEALVGIVEGMPAGLELRASDIDFHLARRWKGVGRGGRSKFESDNVHLYSGVRFSKTIGSPIAIRIDNDAYLNDRSGWPKIMATDGSGEGVDAVTMPRPGHADLVGVQKYRFSDIRPVIDRASARETAIRVACCSVARKLLKEFGIEVGSHVIQIGGAGWDTPQEYRDIVESICENGAEQLFQRADNSGVRIIDDQLSEQCIDRIKRAKSEGDSLGGSYEVIVTGVPVGLGSYVHWDRRLDGLLAQAVLSIQGQKAVEIGDGLASAREPGSVIHDPIVLKNGTFSRIQNRAGGVEGGVSNGMPIVIRGYMKPIPTMIKPLESVDIKTFEHQPTRYERSDVTSVPAASTVAEATVAFVIANALLEKLGGDSIDEIRDRFDRVSKTVTG